MTSSTQPRPHFCDHPDTDMGGHTGCPRWPGCLTPGPASSTTPPALVRAVALGPALDNGRRPLGAAIVAGVILVAVVVLAAFVLGAFVLLAFHLAV